MKTKNSKNHFKHNQHGLIVGASGGIGAVIANRLVKEGWVLGLSARNQERLEALGINGAHIWPRDASKREDVETLFDQVKQEFPQLDLVVITPGGHKVTSLEHSLGTFEQDLEEMLSSNLVGPALVAFRAAQVMKAQGYGRIVLVSSQAAVRSLPGNLGYSSAKAGTHGFCNSLRAELVGTKIHITEVMPATVNTDSMKDHLKGQADRAVQPEDVAEAVLLITNLSPHANIPEMIIDGAVRF